MKTFESGKGLFVTSWKKRGLPPPPISWSIKIVNIYAYFHHHYLLTIITRFTKWSCSQTCVIPWMASRSPGHMCLLASTRNPRTPMFIWWRWSGDWWWQWCSENLLGLPRRCNNRRSFLWHTWEEQVTVDNYEVDSIKPILDLGNTRWWQLTVSPRPGRWGRPGSSFEPAKIYLTESSKCLKRGEVVWRIDEMFKA